MLAAVLMLGAAAQASATTIVPGCVTSVAGNLVQNGGFECSQYTANTEFGSEGGTTGTGTGATNPLIQGVTDWTSVGSNSFSMYWVAGTATYGLANAQCAATRFNDCANILVNAFKNTPSPNGGGNFIGMDADPTYASQIQQSISGLVVGDHYQLSFDWGATQLENRTGGTSDYMTISLGSDTRTTSSVAIGSQGFSGWMSPTFVFTASAATELLSFLAISPNTGLPPFVLLDNVDLTDIPEPLAGSMLLVGAAATLMARRKRHKPKPN
jgi:hypothetical protein